MSLLNIIGIGFIKYLKERIRTMGSNYLILVISENDFGFFIDNIVLFGNKKKLVSKLQDIDYVKKLGIHESFYFDKFKLISENEVCFPKYNI